MSFNDPIAEFLTKIRNAQTAKHKFVDVSISKMKLSIVNIMKDKGFIENFLVNDKARKMRIFLKYSNRKPIIRKLLRISKPGRRIYQPFSKLPKVLGGIGLAVISTSTKGICDDETARRNKIGGEILCYIW
ncbi:MAG: 30S ribosomal protein S8 [Parachlamydiales bacterium]|nr:30S ribosomal protein S8 [Parachlamydiales bacterium]